MTFYDNTWLSLDLSAVVCLRMKRGVRKVMPTGMPEHTPPRMAPGIRAPGMVPLPVCACMAPRAAETAPRGSGGGVGDRNRGLQVWQSCSLLALAGGSFLPLISFQGPGVCLGLQPHHPDRHLYFQVASPCGSVSRYPSYLPLH